MLHTPICDLLGIDFPIIQAGMGPFTSAELVAAVSNTGGLGSLGAGARPIDSFKKQLHKTLELTKRPFAVNHTLSPRLPDREMFTLTLQAHPHLVSLSLGDPSDYIKLIHDAGILVMHQVTTVKQAYQAAQAGVDIIIAQGSESGGFSGTITSMVLIPQIVDAISPIPVVAAGGIATGRGLVAALALGAQAVNIGTRFLASSEAPISEEWKKALLTAESQDAIKIEFWKDIFPPGEHAYQAIPRTLTSPFIEKWQDKGEIIRKEAERLRGEVGSAIELEKFGELFPFTGQSAGQIKEILPAAEIVHEIINEAQTALQQLAQLST